MEDVDTAAERERVVSGLRRARKGRRISTEGKGFVVNEESEFGEGVAVAGEVAEVVPAHSVYVSLSDFVGELGMMAGEEGIEVFIAEKLLLLDYLGVDVGGTEGFDLCD